MSFEELIRRKSLASADLTRRLEAYESSVHRVIVLDESFRKLASLPVDVSDYFEESLNALKVGCYRASVIMGWAGFIRVFAQHLLSSYQRVLNSNYPSWGTSSVEQLLEGTPEYQIIDVAVKLKAIKKQTGNIYKGWLSSRNQCAHPTLYQPSRNVSIGYIDALIAEIRKYI